MRVVVSAEVRYDRTPDGRVWTNTGLAESFWHRYLSAFDRVRVVARVREVTRVPGTAMPVDGEAVEVWPVPYYVGPWEYGRRWWQVRRAVREAATATGPNSTDRQVEQAASCSGGE